MKPIRARRRRDARGAPPLESDVATLRALAHPLRLELVQLFAGAPRTVREAADTLRLPRTRLYHHVAALQQARLIRVRERRPHRGAVEQVYEAVRIMARARKRRGDPIRIPPALAHAVLDRARADLVAALAGTKAPSVRLIHLIADDRRFIAAVRRHIAAITREAARAAERAEVRAAERAGTAPRPAKGRGPGTRATTGADTGERWSLTVSLVPTKR